MTLNQWFAVGALASLPFAAMAQQAPQQLNPLDANAPVPASTYESAFKTYRPSATGEQVSPDKAWRAANDEMGRLGGHAGHMKNSPDSQAPASTAPHSAPQQSGAVDHHKHH